MKQETTNHKERIFKWIALGMFLVYAVIGLICFDDYGCGPDEGMERQTSLVNLKYVVEKLHIPISEQNRVWMEYLPELKEYRDRYYGTALHFPVVLIESAAHFTMTPAQFYGMRHLYTFLVYSVGLVCLYFLVSNRFGSRKYGLFALLIMILTPRFFAESFYNNKDVIFMGIYMVCSFLMDRWFRRKSLRCTILLAFVLALTCNTRLNGIIFLAILMFVFLFDSLQNRKVDGLGMLLLTLGLTVLFFYLITPNFWESPVQTMIETLQFNMRHPNHGSEGNLFKGVLVDAARTYTYIPVWIMITVPTVYLVFSLIGTVIFGVQTVRDFWTLRFERINVTDLILFISGFAAVGFIIAAHVTIYNGWRHCYFAYPCIVYFAVRFLHDISDGPKSVVRILPILFLAAALLYNGVWIFRNHPYEYVYFAPAFRSRADEFSGDYWGISTRALLEYITRTDPERMIRINHTHTQAGSINRGLLPEVQQKYIELTYDEADVDYYVIVRDDIHSVDIVQDGFEKVWSIFVDNDEIGAVFRMKGSE